MVPQFTFLYRSFPSFPHKILHWTLPSTTSTQIKSHYHKLALKYHSDTKQYSRSSNGGIESKEKVDQECINRTKVYETLSNNTSRKKQYDGTFNCYHDTTRKNHNDRSHSTVGHDTFHSSEKQNISNSIPKSTVHQRYYPSNLVVALIVLTVGTFIGSLLFLFKVKQYQKRKPFDVLDTLMTRKEINSTNNNNNRNRNS